MQAIVDRKVPVCWNYLLSEYPPSFKEIDDVDADFTQEYTALDYDSDGGSIVMVPDVDKNVDGTPNNDNHAEVLISSNQ
jgi:hypothetical protein